MRVQHYIYVTLTNTSIVVCKKHVPMVNKGWSLLEVRPADPEWPCYFSCSDAEGDVPIVGDIVKANSAH